MKVQLIKIHSQDVIGLLNSDDTVTDSRNRRKANMAAV